MNLVCSFLAGLLYVGGVLALLYSVKTLCIDKLPEEP